VNRGLRGKGGYSTCCVEPRLAYRVVDGDVRCQAGSHASIDFARHVAVCERNARH